MKKLKIIDDNETNEPIDYLDLFEALMNTRIHFKCLEEEEVYAADCILKSIFDRLTPINCIKKYKCQELPDDESLEYYYNAINDFYWIDKKQKRVLDKRNKTKVVSLENYRHTNGVLQNH